MSPDLFFPESGSIRRPLKFAVVLVVLAVFARARPLLAAPEVVDAALVSRLAAEMRDQHPALRALKAREDAARLGARGTRRWADPTLTAGGVAYRLSTMAKDNGDLFYGVQQSLPILGKQRAARGVADSEEAMAGTRLAARFVEMRRDLALTLVAAAYERASVALLREDLVWLDARESTARARLASGRESVAQLLRLENERARLRVDLTNGIVRLADAGAAVRRALGRTNAESPGEFTLPPVGPELRDDERLQQIAETSDPMVRTSHAEARVADATLVATRRSSRPDVALGVQAYQYSGDGGIAQGMFGVTINFPWFNRANYRRDIERDEARVRASRLEETNAASEVRRLVHRLVAEAGSARRMALLYRDDIRPRTATTLGALEASWMPGGAELRDLLETRRQLVEADRMVARATADYWNAVHEVLLCCGLDDLPPLPDPARLLPSPSQPTK
jgi:outer membrane protein TolC